MRMNTALLTFGFLLLLPGLRGGYFFVAIFPETYRAIMAGRSLELLGIFLLVSVVSLLLGCWGMYVLVAQFKPRKKLAQGLSIVILLISIAVISPFIASFWTYSGKSVSADLIRFLILVPIIATPVFMHLYWRKRL